MVGTPAAGWYRDPSGAPGRIRFYDGTAWTSQVRTLTTPPDNHAPATAAPAASTAQENAEAAWASATTGAGADDPLRGWRPKPRPTSAEAGWYPDPGRSTKLRFYDGTGWTARVRVPLDNRKRHLPAAAVALRARMLEIADATAAKSDAGARWRTIRHTVSAPQPLPSLHLVVRSRSGRVGGMLSMAAVIAGVMILTLAGWQHLGANTLQGRSQDQLRAQLSEEFSTYGGEFATSYTGEDPTPAAVPAATATATPSARPQPSRPPQLNSRPADITPFPPAGWTPPADRKARNLSGYRSGAPVGRMVIPRLGLDEVMVAGTGAAELAKGPGVAKYGMLPGSPGNAVVAGHRTGWGEPFRHLERLRYGDQIIVEVPGQERVVYEVRGRSIVSPYNTSVAEQTEGVRLTLTTCTPVSVNTHRMIVQAEMVEGPWLDQAVNRSKFRTLR